MRSKVVSLLCFCGAAGAAYGAGIYEGLSHHPNALMIVAACGLFVVATIFLFSRD